MAAPWRDTAIPVRFGPLEGWAALPFALLLVSFSLRTLLFATAAAIFFRYLERRGLRLRHVWPAFRARAWPSRPPRSTQHLRRWRP